LEVKKPNSYVEEKKVVYLTFYMWSRWLFSVNENTLLMSLPVKAWSRNLFWSARIARIVQDFEVA
jgi:hypothetical protein